MERSRRPRHCSEVIRDIAKQAVKHLATQPLASHGQHTFPKNHQEFIPFEEQPSFHEADTFQVDPDGRTIL
jgi:hypothetical protein